MKRFAALFAELDATTSTNAKVEALQRYFEQAPARDAAWAVYFLAGGKPRQVVPTSRLAMLACEVAGVAPWLFDECYQAVGDLAETIALVLPRGGDATDVGLAQWVEERLLPLRGLSEAEIAVRVKSYWGELDTQGRFLLTKLVGGGFRVGVSKLVASWLEFARRREQSRERGVEGFMLKRLDAAYGTGRTKAEGLWWKWKIEPMTID